MPSKRKKLSKTSIARSRSPATPYREPETAATDVVLNRLLLSDATARFPHLISEPYFRVVVSGVKENSFNGHHARIWLSKDFPCSNSLLPGSLVSVAKVESDKQSLGIVPLYDSVHYNLSHLTNDASSNFLNEAGHYFAIASVLFSNEVKKNGVSLSWSLSTTMGFPAIGQSLLISHIRDFSSCHNGCSRNSTLRLHLHKCQNLKLNLLPITFHEILLTNNSSTKLTSISSGYEEAKSPNTPLFPSKLPSNVSTPLPSKNSSGSSASINSFAYLDLPMISHILANEESRALYEKTASIWLCGRFLLFGNLVSIPSCGNILLSSVEGADELTSFSSQEPNFEVKNNALFNEDKRVTYLDRKYTVLHMEAKTTISSSIPTSTTRKCSSERVFPEYVTRYISGNEPNDIPTLGGLSKEITALEEIIKVSLEHKDASSRLTGVLLHGLPGTGKTSLASYCVRKSGARLFLVNGSDIGSQYYRESEQSLRNKFDLARRSAPAVIFIDELDAIAPAPNRGVEPLYPRMVDILSKLMDDIRSSYGIFVIAATNQLYNVDPSLRRHGRFRKEIEIGKPSPDQRLDILHTLLNHIDHSLSNSEMESLAFDTHGFVGADLSALCNEAAMTAFRRFISFESPERLLKDSHFKTSAIDMYVQVPNIQAYEEIQLNDSLNSISSLLSKLAVSPVSTSYDSYGEEKKVMLKVFGEDFEVAKMNVRPSAMREVMLNLPNVSWEDVGGQKEVKAQLIEAIEWRHKYPDALKAVGVQPPRGLLMVGPPGCSKTLMARAVASEAKLNFLAVKGPELFNQWVGESEKAVRSIFAKARANSPAIIFFDEIDSLAVTRDAENDGTSVGDRVLSQLLVEMDGLDQREDVIVIAATNRPDKIDPALRRPGRFDRILDVQPPNEMDREDIFRIHTKGMPCSPGVSLKELARLTEGYTGADIKLVCHEAGIAALEESFEITEISMEHFRIGIGRVHPTEVAFYQKLAQQYRR